MEMAKKPSHNYSGDLWASSFSLRNNCVSRREQQTWLNICLCRYGSSQTKANGIYQLYVKIHEDILLSFSQKAWCYYTKDSSSAGFPEPAVHPLPWPWIGQSFFLSEMCLLKNCSQKSVGAQTPMSFLSIPLPEETYSVTYSWVLYWAFFNNHSWWSSCCFSELVVALGKGYQIAWE